MEQSEIKELVEAFALESKKQYEASCDGKFRIANKTTDKINLLFAKIKTFGDNGRESLFKLTNDTDPSVALMAAAYSMKYKPKECIAIYKRIAKLPDLIGFMAQQGLKNTDNWQIE